MVFIPQASGNKMLHSNDPLPSWDQECMKNNYECISSKWLPFFLILKGERAEKNMQRKKMLGSVYWHMKNAEKTTYGRKWVNNNKAWKMLNYKNSIYMLLSYDT